MNFYAELFQGRLKTREMYMYVHFRGIDFIEEYFAAREKLICGLKEGGVHLEGCFEDYLRNKFGQKVDLGEFVFSDKDLKEDNSLRILSGIALLFIQGNSVIDDEIRRWINRFVHKFEVQKGVFGAHCKWKENEKNDAKVFLCGLLSFVCASAYRSTRNFKYLSCALKVNDFLASVNKSSLQEWEKKLLVVNLELERSLIEEFCVKNGVVSSCS